MPRVVTMPKWGLTMKAGTVTRWLRVEGDRVAAGEPLLVVETDKATNEVEAPADGVLRRIAAAEGAEVAVGAPVAVIAAPEEVPSDEEIAALIAASTKVNASAGPAAGARPAREARAAARDESGRVNASPAARKLAAELGVDLATVQASGPGGRITSDDVQRAADVASAVTEDYVTLRDGRRLFYVLAGPPGSAALVFLHGLGGSQSTWQNVLGELASDFRVCALDLPGHGASDKPAPSDADYSLAGLARAVLEAIDALALAPCTLVGHSLGGAVALEAALLAPDKVSRLVLIDSAGLGDELNPELLDRVEAPPGREESRRLLELFFHDPRFVLESGVEENYAGRLQPGADEAVRAVAAAAGFTRSGQQTGLPARLGRIAAPALILWGAHDRVIPSSHAEVAAAAIPDSHVHVLPDSGHVPQIEAAAEVAHLLRQFKDEFLGS